MHQSINAKQLAEIVNGKIIGDGNVVVNGVSSLKDATSHSISFVGNKKYQSQLSTTKAGIVLLCLELEDEPLNGRTFIVCDNVDMAFAKAIMIFAPDAPRYSLGVHPTAVVATSAVIGNNVHIGANAVIMDAVSIGDNTVIGAGTYIGHETKIGADCQIAPNVTIMYRCYIGNRAIIHPGVVIGGDGFGFVPGPKGIIKIPQTGIVQIDDDVEIGANTTVDRARFGKTWIKQGVKIDNQVMIAHNVVIGECSLLVAQSGIAGSAELGRGVILAAKAGVNGHITLGDGVQVAGTSGVVKSLPAGAIALGTPAESQREYMSRWTLPRKVEKLTKRIEELEAELKKRT
jgi:UDP-3-O-[3-hydroxymyristoyl] glucosamine N-acyltransferase